MLMMSPTQHETPKYLSTNFVCWLMFDERTAAVLSSERFVSIEDFSPNGVDFQAPDSASRPFGQTANRINGRRSAGFNDNGAYQSCMRSDTDDADHDLGSGDFTIICVGYSDDDERACFLNKGITPHYQMRFNNADADDGDFVAECRNNSGGGNTTVVDTSITHNSGDARAYMMIRDGTNLRLYWNNVESGSSPTTLTGDLDMTSGTNYLWIGSRNDGSQWFTGQIGEVLIWKRKLTSTELAMVHRYLQRKWGL